MKLTKQTYTVEFRELAVKRVKDVPNIGTAARDIGLNEQPLRHRVKATAKGKLNGAGSRGMTPEEMELPCLRAENG